jgi:CheY-like chemotaxis protein
MLQRLGYTVTGASSGEEALRLLRAEPDRWDLVLTDNAMPGMSGLAFAAALRADHFTLPIVLITGRLEQHEDIKRIALGIRHVLSKPYQRAELAALVADALAHAPDPAPDPPR